MKLANNAIIRISGVVQMLRYFIFVYNYNTYIHCGWDLIEAHYRMACGYFL